MPEVMSAPAPYRPVVSVISSSSPVVSPPADSSSRIWWVLVGILVLIFIGIVVWYFTTR